MAIIVYGIIVTVTTVSVSGPATHTDYICKDLSLLKFDKIQISNFTMHIIFFFFFPNVEGIYIFFFFFFFFFFFVATKN